MTRDKTTEQICETFDITESTLKRWVGWGCPCDHTGKGKPRLFSAEEVAAWKQGRNLTGKPGKPAAQGSDSLQRVKLRKETAMARRAELEVAKEEKKLVEREQVERESIAKTSLVRSKLQQMGAAIAPRLEGLTTVERQNVIDEYCRQLCEDFARA